MADYKAVFDRLGRSRLPDALTVRLTIPDIDSEEDRDYAAEVLYRHCKRYLASSEFTVTVDFSTGQVWVDGGRFGRGRLEKA